MSDKQEKKKLTGYPSVDKPWLKYYSHMVSDVDIPQCSMYQYLYNNNSNYMSDISIRYYGNSISYRQLFENIGKVANAFASMGIGHGDVVTIMSMHTPETIYSIYALNYLGAIANLVYVTLSSNELSDRIKTTSSKMLLILDAVSNKANEIENLSVPVVVLPIYESMPIHLKIMFGTFSRRHKGNHFIGYPKFIKGTHSTATMSNKHDDPAIIVYTSGTTGEPKGVVLTNSALNAHSFQLINAEFGFERGRSFLHVIPPFIGFGISHIHLALNAGVDSTLWLNLKPDAVAKEFFKLKPTYFVSGPTFVDAFLKQRPKNIPNLKLFVGGGSELPETKEDALNELLRACNSNAVYANGYGMTETSSTLCSCTTIINKKHSAGIPMPLTNVKIIDTNSRQELQYGQEGELCFSAPNMMSGYYKNENATNEIIFVDNTGKRWIKTGDLGTVDEDGFVYITGRLKRIYPTIDDKGTVYRLFPQRIEELLTTLDTVKSCAVVAMKDMKRYWVPVVFVVPEDFDSSKDSSVIRTDIINNANDLLSEHERPSELYILKEMPVTLSGKIDYCALEKMALDKHIID